jgi:hypothetical protein
MAGTGHPLCSPWSRPHYLSSFLLCEDHPHLVSGDECKPHPPKNLLPYSLFFLRTDDLGTDDFFGSLSSDPCSTSFPLWMFSSMNPPHSCVCQSFYQISKVWKECFPLIVLYSPSELSMDTWDILLFLERNTGIEEESSFSLTWGSV